MIFYKADPLSCAFVPCFQPSETSRLNHITYYQVHRKYSKITITCRVSNGFTHRFCCYQATGVVRARLACLSCHVRRCFCHFGKSLRLPILVAFKSFIQATLRSLGWYRMRCNDVGILYPEVVIADCHWSNGFKPFQCLPQSDVPKVPCLSSFRRCWRHTSVRADSQSPPSLGHSLRPM